MDRTAVYYRGRLVAGTVRKLLDALPSDLPLVVRTDRLSYAPAERIRATVVAGPAKEDIALTELVVTLQHELEYEFETDYGSDSGTHTKTQVDRETKAEERVNLGQTLAAGGSAEWAFDFEAPDGPASADGEILESRWLVDALVPLPRVADARAASQIRVTPQPKKSEWARKPRVDTRVLLDLALSLERWELAMGETLSGTLLVRPQERVKATEIRVDFLVRERVEVRDGKDWLATVATKTLAGGSTLEAGNDLELPFEIEVPASAPPTLDVGVGSISWMLQGVVARRLRSDTLIEQAITVYEPPHAEVDPIESGLFAHPPGDDA